jgi:transcription elongation GreA/GreB family factor
MSRAFVKETDGEAADMLPDRPVSSERNLVTQRGYRQIEERLAYWRSKDAASLADDLVTKGRIARELRYWMARWTTAELVEPPREPAQVVFATTVRLRRPDGSIRQISLVGEDESEPDKGRIAWTAPLARVLMGLEEGEVVPFQGEDLEVVSIEPITGSQS